MKALVLVLLLLPSLLWSQQRLSLDSALTELEQAVLIDSALNRADSLNNIPLALVLTKQGLDLAEKGDNVANQARFHIKLAKYFYRLDQVDEALVHFRLYALLNERLIRDSLTRGMVVLEDAYLDQLTLLNEEMTLDKKLIENLQRDNERYFLAQKRINLAVRIGIIALAFVMILWVYNRFSKRKTQAKAVEDEEQEMTRLREMVSMLREEQERSQVAVERLRAQLKANASFATSMQSALLKNQVLDKKRFKQSFLFESPRDSISGDFLFSFESGSKSILAVVDCPGHGVDASYSTITVNDYLLENVENGITAPSMLLTMVDQKLKQEYERAGLVQRHINGIRIGICEIDQKTKEIEFAGAQFPLFYIHLDKVHLLKGNKYPIGDPVFSDKFYSSDHARLSTGDMVYFVTDGFYNQIGGKSAKRFTRGSFVNLLESMHSQTLPEQKFVLEKVFKEWRGSNRQTDDILVLGIRL